jgi:Flp pilus assembly pilin Flp
MEQWFGRFWREEEGQDIIEYSLLITFIALSCLWFLSAGHDSVLGIWTTTNSGIAVANAAASGGH